MSILELDGEETAPYQLLRHERRRCRAIARVQVRIAGSTLDKFDAELTGPVLIEDGLDYGDAVFRDLRVLALILEGNIPAGWTECQLSGAGDA